MDNNDLYCSFCGKVKSETDILVTGLEANICNNCIIKANTIVIEEEKGNTSQKPTNTNSFTQNNLNNFIPQKIKTFLDDYVIGQEEAKKTLSIATYNHYKRIFYNDAKNNDTEIQKSNVLLIGPSGTGKTILVQTLAKMLDVPLAIVDATVLTEAGYVGEDVESILSKLLQIAEYDVKKTERGIIFIDEIDKIARKSDNPSITRDVSGEGVQQALLKLLEGSTINVPPKGGRKHPDQDFVKINTENILFIAGGAFDGIEKIIYKRLNLKSIGYKATEKNKAFNKQEETVLKYINPKDLKSFGLIPEIIGRMPVFSYMNTLTAKELKRILLEPKNAIIKQYIKLFEIDGIKLSIKEEALDIIVKKAIEYNLGARGLRSLCEKILSDAMFSYPGSNKKTLTITENYIKKEFEKQEKSALLLS